MQGSIEVEVSHGEKRIFHPGNITFVEDTTGRGHITRVVSDEDAVIAICPVDKD